MIGLLKTCYKALSSQDTRENKNAIYLDDRLIKTPVALEQAKRTHKVNKIVQVRIISLFKD